MITYPDGRMFYKAKEIRNKVIEILGKGINLSAKDIAILAKRGLIPGAFHDKVRNKCLFSIDSIDIAVAVVREWKKRGCTIAQLELAYNKWKEYPITDNFKTINLNQWMKKE